MLPISSTFTFPAISAFVEFVANTTVPISISFISSRISLIIAERSVISGPGSDLNFIFVISCTVNSAKLISVPVASKLVNVPAAGVVLPIVVLSKDVASNVVNVPAAAIVFPITVLLIALVASNVVNLPDAWPVEPMFMLLILPVNTTPAAFGSIFITCKVQSLGRKFNPTKDVPLISCVYNCMRPSTVV